MNDVNDAAATALLWTRRLLHFGNHAGCKDYCIDNATDSQRHIDDILNDVYNNRTGTTGTTDNASDDSSGDVVILNAFILLLSGFGIVMGIVLGTYFASVVFDKYCCCCPGFVAVGSLEEIDQGSMARKAGLWGLRLSERQAILKKVFAEKQIVYHARRFPVASVAATIEASNVDEKVSQGVAENELEENTPKKDEATEETDIEQGDGLNPPKDEEKDDDADHERVCCICLAEYEEGCTLLKGSSCVHKFHYDCAAVWLLRHDECPYCRILLVSPKDFREAAIPLLGEGRINDLAYSGARRIPVAAVVSTTTASLQTNEETESQQTAAAGEEAVADLETGGHSVDTVDAEVMERGAIAAEVDGTVQAEEVGDIEMTTKPTDDATTEPDLEIGDCDDAVHDSKSTATSQ
jgi:hypothetical protein